MINLESKLVEILDSLQSAAAKAVEVAGEQLPLLAQEFILYNRVLLTSGLVISLAFLGLGIYLVIAAAKNKYWKESTRFWEDSRMGVMAAGCATLVTSLIVCFILLKQTLLVWLAPKIFLLIAIKDLIK